MVQAVAVVQDLFMIAISATNTNVKTIYYYGEGQLCRGRAEPKVYLRSDFPISITLHQNEIHCTMSCTIMDSLPVRKSENKLSSPEGDEEERAL